MRRTKHLPLEELQPFLFDPPKFTVETPFIPIVWRELFQNDAPVEIEVGFGKGLFLVNSAMQRPNTNFFGIEIERKLQLFTANRIAKRDLRNVRLACADARDLFTRCMSDESVQTIHIFFPDPWWKKRHHKRRLFTDAFAEQCIRILTIGGRLHIVSDVQEYFEMIREMMDQRQELHFLETPKTNEPQHEQDYLTNFERKFRKQNLPIYRVLYEKMSPAGKV